MELDPDKFDDDMCEWLRVIWLKADDEERALNLLNLVFKVAKHAGMPGLAYCSSDLFEGALDFEQLGRRRML